MHVTASHATDLQFTTDEKDQKQGYKTNPNPSYIIVETNNGMGELSFDVHNNEL